MKIDSMFGVLVFFVCFMTLSSSFLALAQYNSGRQAQADAERDAEASVDKAFWFTAGCFGGPIGLVGAYTYHRPLPSVQLLGKSATYVAFYADAYRAKAQEVQTVHAGMGCVLTVGLPMILTMLQFQRGRFR